METEPFLALAEIAGIFVGFATLISVRGGETIDSHAKGYLRVVVLLGIWVVAFALLPVAISFFGVDGHALWLSCAIPALAGYAASFFARDITPELTTSGEKEWQRRHPIFIRSFMVVGGPVQATMVGSMVLIIIGILPELEPALYFAGLTAAQLFAAWTLLMLVYSQRTESSTPAEIDESGPPSGDARGGEAPPT